VASDEAIAPTILDVFDHASAVHNTMSTTGRRRGVSAKLLRWRNTVAQPSRPFTGGRGRRILFITESGSIPESQIFPFFFYAPEIEKRWPHETREVTTRWFEAQPERAPAGADIVCVQTWFDLDAARADRLFSAVRTCSPNAKVVFFDSFAPTDLRLARVVDRYIDVYVKKHLFRDRQRYGQITLGDTVLDEYYGRLYGLPEQPPTRFEVPDGFFGKLVLGPTFSTAAYMLPHLYDHGEPHGGDRSIDVHARLGGAQDGWYGRMRDASITAIRDAARHSRLVDGEKVKLGQYMRELRSARVCFSPFGYGEVCWRDYEAVLSGALVIKQNMSHVEVCPDIFIPDETYAPIAWDFSDLPEVLSRWLSDEPARRKAVMRAYTLLHEYSRGARFVDQMRPVLSL
jgi:hypothetical protein